MSQVLSVRCAKFSHHSPRIEPTEMSVKKVSEIVESVKHSQR